MDFATYLRQNITRDIDALLSIGAISRETADALQKLTQTSSTTSAATSTSHNAPEVSNKKPVNGVSFGQNNNNNNNNGGNGNGSASITPAGFTPLAHSAVAASSPHLSGSGATENGTSNNKIGVGAQRVFPFAPQTLSSTPAPAAGSTNMGSLAQRAVSTSNFGTPHSGSAASVSAAAAAAKPALNMPAKPTPLVNTSNGTPSANASNNTTKTGYNGGTTTVSNPVSMPLSALPERTAPPLAHLKHAPAPSLLEKTKSQTSTSGLSPTGAPPSTNSSPHSAANSRPTTAAAMPNPVSPAAIAAAQAQQSGVARLASSFASQNETIKHPSPPSATATSAATVTVAAAALASIGAANSSGEKNNGNNRTSPNHQTHHPAPPRRTNRPSS